MFFQLKGGEQDFLRNGEFRDGVHASLLGSNGGFVGASPNARRASPNARCISQAVIVAKSRPLVKTKIPACSCNRGGLAAAIVTIVSCAVLISCERDSSLFSGTPCFWLPKLSATLSLFY